MAEAEVKGLKDLGQLDRIAIIEDEQFDDPEFQAFERQFAKDAIYISTVGKPGRKLKYMIWSFSRLAPEASAADLVRKIIEYAYLEVEA